MSIVVKVFHEQKAKVELKKCPKIVRDYVKLLVESRDRSQQLTHDAIIKLRVQAQEIERLMTSSMSQAEKITELESDIKCMKSQKLY